MKIAIISDIHSNLEAFQAVLKDIKKRKIRKILCAGDIVGYNANPDECIDLIKENKILSVMGNHDLCCANLEKIGWFNEYGQQAALWQNKILTLKNKQFLLKLPKSIKKDNLFIVHGSPSDELYEYVFPETSPWDLRKFFNLTKRQILIMGHTHTPFIKKFRNKLIINPGSVGQPRDANPRASYCILDNKNLKAKIVRIPYNIDIAANKILKNRLPDFLAKRLFLGT